MMYKLVILRYIIAGVKWVIIMEVKFEFNDLSLHMKNDSELRSFINSINLYHYKLLLIEIKKKLYKYFINK